MTGNAGGSFFVSLYVICPFCQHPVVLPAAQSGHKYVCRQCNGKYTVTFSKRHEPTEPPQSESPITPIELKIV